MAEEGARETLAHFLKTRRARLAPADVGLPAGAGRRVRGLRREEVAVLAGVGLTWYSWLEQGREIQVSTSFLENLARALRLSEAERAYLFSLAHHRPPPGAATAPAAHGAGTLARVQAILDAIARPAYARNARFDVLAWNAANTAMFGDFACEPARARNIVRRMFAHPYYRRTMPSWEADARALVAKFRLAHAQAGGDPAFAALVQEMVDTSPEFRRVWAEHAVSDLGEGVTSYRSSRHGLLVFRHSTLMPEVMPEARIVVYLAADS